MLPHTFMQHDSLRMSQKNTPSDTTIIHQLTLLQVVLQLLLRLLEIRNKAYFSGFNQMKPTNVESSSWMCILPKMQQIGLDLHSFFSMRHKIFSLRPTAGTTRLDTSSRWTNWINYSSSHTFSLEIVSFYNACLRTRATISGKFVFMILSPFLQEIHGS